jgi:hypothetical protein
MPPVPVKPPGLTSVSIGSKRRPDVSIDRDFLEAIKKRRAQIELVRVRVVPFFFFEVKAFNW